ncbi:hypothetical protein AURDEDRAFT_173776 [Auricularia subglabra TFB-10046 SS5]|nr:hypothetical protein AURDEDRAFT_173776 [Auricularia subglabra TFB-10046 SS5]
MPSNPAGQMSGDQPCETQDTDPIIPRHEIGSRMKAFLNAVCDPLNPTCCPWCFALLVTSTWTDTTNMLSLQKRGHDFIQACICMLVLYSESGIPTLRMALAKAQRACPERETLHKHRSHGVLKDPFDILLESLLHVVQVALICGDNPVCTASGLGVSFHRRNGFWPVEIKQLFPLGVARTVDALVHWACAPLSGKPLDVLVSYIRVVRPVVFPVLLESPRRDRVVWLVLQALTPGPGVPWTDDEPPFAMPPGLSAPIKLRRDGELVSPAIYVLSNVRCGSQAHGDDAQRLFAGYEAPIRAALKAMIVPPEHVEHVPDYICFLSTALGDDAGCPHTFGEMPKRELLYNSLVRKIGERWCCGPRCDKNEISFDEGVRRFLCCEHCLLVRYCSRECQRKDWKRGAHRDMCPILATARRRGLVVTEGYTKFTETITNAEMEVEDLDALYDWALGGNFVSQSKHLPKKGK